MKITEIYEKYKIMKSLQLHMFRVAGVAKIICDNIKVEVDRENIITACLLHDMGNIIKFNLKIFPEFLQPEGEEYWQKVKDEFMQKYQSDEHKATYMIAQELEVNDRVLEILDCIGFAEAKKNFESNDYGKKIAAYADNRVAPNGVVSLEERLGESKIRYRIVERGEEKIKSFIEFSNYIKKIEGQIFAQCTIKASDINNETVDKEVEELMGFRI